jgi:WD40 repeat protein
MRILKGPRNAVFQVAFSPDGRFLAAGGGRFVTLWDVTSEKPVHKWPLQGCCAGLAFSPDQEFLAAADDNTAVIPDPGELIVWRLAAPHRPQLRAPGGRQNLQFHPSGSWLLVQGVDEPLLRWDVSSWTSRVLWDNRHNWSGIHFCRARISPDGRSLARRVGIVTFAGANDVVELYDLGNGDLIRSIHLLGHGSRNGDFCPDGRRFVLLQRNHLVVLDLVEGREVVRRKSGRKRFDYLAVSPDNRWVLTTPGKEVHLWSTHDWQERRVLDFAIGEILCLDVARDGQRAAAGGSSGQTVIWDLE